MNELTETGVAPHFSFIYWGTLLGLVSPNRSRGHIKQLAHLVSEMAAPHSPVILPLFARPSLPLCSRYSIWVAVLTVIFSRECFLPLVFFSHNIG